MRTLRLLALAWVVGGTTAVIHGEEGEAQPGNQGIAFVIRQFRCVDIADKVNPDKWVTLFNLTANHHESIEITSIWVDLRERKSDKLFARRKVEYLPQQDGRFVVAIGFKGAHTRLTYPSCIIEFRFKGKEEVHRVLIQNFPGAVLQPLPEKLENQEIPETLQDRKPPAPAPPPQRKRAPRPNSSAAQQAIV